MALTRLPSFTLLDTDSFTFANITLTSNVNANNANLGNAVTANYFIGSAANLSSIPGANVTGQVSNSVLAGTVYTNAQPNITSVGTLTSLAVTGNITSGNANLGNSVVANFFTGNGHYLTSLLGSQVAGEVAYANLANSVAGANVTGTVASATVATSANSVAVANVTGIGNIATINKDGNSSNILYGNGEFASAPVTYGNSNVASYLASFGSNVINTTGNITAAHFNGDGSNISNVNAVSLNGHSDTYFASTTYVNTAIANLVASAPAALDTLNELAAALGNDASYSSTITNSLANKLNSNAFTYANLTGTPTLGNIASLNIDGNSSNILYGNGVFSGAPVTYNDSNVETYLPNYAGDLSPGNITIAPANLKISGGTADYVLKTDGAGNLSWTAMAGGTGASDLANLTDVALANLAQGDILSYDSANSKWINTVNAGGTGSASSQYVTRTATGDGSTVAYTVSTGATTNSVIVTLSGIVQTPTTDYTVSGTTLTFTSAPDNGIAIQIREIGIPMSSGSNTQLLFNDAGSISGTANLTFNKTTGMLTAAKLTTTSANLGSAANLKITGGNVGDLLATVGNGVLAWANVAANGNVIINGSVGGGGASVTVADTPPSTPAEGDLWLDSESGELNVYFSDAWAAVSASAGQLDIQVNNFTGDGTQTEFTLTVTPAGSNYTIVTVGGVTQPRNYYSVSGATLTFSSPPPNNTPIEVSIFGGTASPIGLAASVTNAAQPNITSVGTLLSLTSSGNITAPYFIGNGSALTGITAATSTSAGTVTANAQSNITSVGTLTSLSVTGNISTGNAALGNLATANFFSGNGSSLSSITASNVTGQVSNSLVAGTVYTNAQPNITSLGSLVNLSVSGLTTLGLLAETFSPQSGATGTVVHDTAATSTFYHTTPAANFTANFTNVSTTSNKIIVVAIVVAQGSSVYLPTVMQIDGTTQTVIWSGGSAPTGNANKYDIISYSLFRFASSWTVFGSASSFG